MALPTLPPQACGLHALHPYSQAAADAHRAGCEEQRGGRESAARGRLVECGICLERCGGWGRGCLKGGVALGRLCAG